MARSVLRIGVLELRRRPGTQREVHLSTPLEGLVTTAARVPDDAEVAVDAVLEAVEGGVTISGTVSAPWEGPCRRCLEPVTGTVEAGLSEVFEPHPTEGETYPLEGDEVDLEPVVRDAVLLQMPLAPLCSEDCAGPAPETFPTSSADEAEDSEAAPPADPRWAALEQLKFD